MISFPKLLERNTQIKLMC